MSAVRYCLPPSCPECLAEPPGFLADYVLLAGQGWGHHCGSNTWGRVNWQPAALKTRRPGLLAALARSTPAFTPQQQTWAGTFASQGKPLLKLRRIRTDYLAAIGMLLFMAVAAVTMVLMSTLTPR